MSYDDFIGDDKTIDAVVRDFEIIDKAANKIAGHLIICSQCSHRNNG
jgi:hypothetical protein